MHAYRQSADYRTLMRHLRRLWVAAGILGLVLVTGVVGFRLIEGFTVGEALYMTLLTVSTVGFMEVHPLSPEGRMFTSGLIVVNIGIFAYFVSATTQLLLEGELRHSLKVLRMHQRIEKLSGHSIVVGYGRIGQQVIEEFERTGHPFVLIDNEEGLLRQFGGERADRLWLLGDATEETTLQRANIARATTLVCTLPSDADNVYVALTAQSLNPQLSLICRASHAEAIPKLRRAGAKHVIWPERVGAQRMALIVTRPSIYEFMGLLNSPGGQGVFFTEVSVGDLLPEYQNIVVAELDARATTGATLLGLRDGTGGYTINPPVDRLLTADCRVVVLGNNTQLEAFQQRYVQPGVALGRY